MTDNSLPGAPTPIPISHGEKICKKCGKPFYIEIITMGNGKKATINCPHCGAIVSKGMDDKGIDSK